VRAINEDCAADVKQLKVDGGACENNFLMQFQADVLGIPVERPVMRDSTVQGAAFAAGLVSGFWESYAELIDDRPIDRIFEPSSKVSQIRDRFATWQKAVERAKHWAD